MPSSNKTTARYKTITTVKKMCIRDSCITGDIVENTEDETETEQQAFEENKEKIALDTKENVFNDEDIKVQAGQFRHRAGAFARAETFQRLDMIQGKGQLGQSRPVSYTHLTYRSFPQWEIIAFVTDVAHHHRNVTEECLFNFQGAG